MVAKYIHFQPIFPTSSSSFPLQVQAIHKINRILLTLLQILIKSFVSNILTEISHNLNKYVQYIFKVVFSSTHWNRFVLLVWEWKVAQNFLRILVTIFHFKDRNWVSKTVYYFVFDNHMRILQNSSPIGLALMVVISEVFIQCLEDKTI